MGRVLHPPNATPFRKFRALLRDYEPPGIGGGWAPLICMNQAHLRLVVARYWIGVELPADAEEAEAEAGHEKNQSKLETNQS